MDVKSQHIEVLQSLNQIGANRNGKYQSDQIDWVLNKMQDRFIRSCLKDKTGGGFELDQVKSDDISNLVVSNVGLNAYLDGTNRYKTFLPPNYQYLLSDYSTTKNLCGTETAVVLPKTLYLDAIRQTRSAKGSAKYYVTNTVLIKGTTVAITDFPYGYSYTGFNSVEDFIFLVPHIAKMGGWYWEKVAGNIYPQQYVRLSETAGSGTSKITVDGTDYTNGTIDTLSLQVHTNTGTAHVNRLTPSNLIPSLNTPFYKSSYYSPISELNSNVLYIYRDSSFTVSVVTVSYIRKPQPISLSLNTSSELSSSACQIICDLSVEYIKGVLENVDGVKIKNNDMDRRVTI